MKKLLILTLVLLYSTTLTAHTETPLKATIEKTVTIKEAHTAAFGEIELWKDLSGFSPIDPNFDENKRELKSAGSKKLNTRIITIFHNGRYEITNFNELGIQRNYHPNGDLLYVDYYNPDSEYPITSYKYCYGNHCQKYSLKSGDLIRVIVQASKSNSFIFTPDGQLSAYWKENYCYLPDGTICGKRQTFIERSAEKK